MFEDRIYNFNAGPATLPNSMMQKAHSEFLNYHNLGYSVLEMNHRGTHFLRILEDTKSLLKELMHIPDEYEILFTHGGATFQFSAIPLNLLNENETAFYVISGHWSKKSFEEAKKFNPVSCFNPDENFYKIPKLSQPNQNAKYVYLTSNNTIYGTQYQTYPKFENQYLVCDMTSDILSRKLDVKEFGLIFAGAQKNLGPAGVCVVILKKELLNTKKRTMPVLMDYEVLINNNSLYNTPATYSIYLIKLVLEDLKGKGGVEVIEEENKKKAKLFYDFLDKSSLFYAPVEKNSRSTMNVIFFMKNNNLESKFLEQAEKEGLHSLKGYRTLGGFRASIYNAMPLSGVEKLVSFMSWFERKS